MCLYSTKEKINSEENREEILSNAKCSMQERKRVKKEDLFMPLTYSVSSSNYLLTSKSLAMEDTSSPGFHPGGGTQYGSETPASSRISASSADSRQYSMAMAPSALW
jgi:hypothetical protein